MVMTQCQTIPKRIPCSRSTLQFRRPAIRPTATTSPHATGTVVARVARVVAQWTWCPAPKRVLHGVELVRMVVWSLTAMVGGVVVDAAG